MHQWLGFNVRDGKIEKILVFPPKTKFLYQSITLLKTAFVNAKNARYFHTENENVYTTLNSKQPRNITLISVR